VVPPVEVVDLFFDAVEPVFDPVDAPVDAVETSLDRLKPLVEVGFHRLEAVSETPVREREASDHRGCEGDRGTDQLELGRGCARGCLHVVIILGRVAAGDAGQQARRGGRSSPLPQGRRLASGSADPLLALVTGPPEET